MSKLRKIYCIAILVMLNWSLCLAQEIPQSEYPLEIEREFNASFEKTWDAVIELIKVLNGTVVATDKPSGIITYSIFDGTSRSLIYINIHIKERPSQETTNVYLIPQVRGGRYYLKGMERDFFDKLEKLLRG